MRRLALLLAIGAVAGCGPAPASTPSRPAPTPAPAPPPTRGGRGAGTGSSAATTPSAAADEVFNRTNTERRKAGLTAFTRSVNLNRAAQIQADQMAAARQLDHNLPGAAYPTLGSRLTAVSYTMRAAGENIAEGQRTASEAVASWMGSSGHRANIVSPTYTELGTAVAAAANGRQYWVQVFGRPR